MAIEGWWWFEYVIHVHRQCDDNITLWMCDIDGTYTEFSSYFYTSTTLLIESHNVMKNLVVLYPNSNLEYVFIGLSFGKSDHYAFHDLLGYININETLSGPFLVFYIHNKLSSLIFINNLSMFVGEENLNRFI